MRRCFQFVAIALCLGLAADAFAALKPEDASGSSNEALQPESGDVPAIQAVILQTGFETTDGFNVGSLEPQNGWSSTGVNLAWQSISTLNPAVGAQHMRLLRNASAASGAQQLVFTPTTPLAPNTPAQFKGMIYISNDQGADYDIIGQAPSQGFLTWRIKFSFSDATGSGPGTIFVLDDVGGTLGFVDTGVQWVEGAYREVKIQHDPAAGEIRYFYGGVLIFTGTIFAGTSVEQVVFRTDNWQLANEHMGFDAFQLLDTPSDPVPASATTWGKIKGQYR